MTGNSPSDDQLTMKRTVKTAAGGWKYTDEAYHPRWLVGFMRHVVKDENGCWRWQGIHTLKGYGQVQYRGKPWNAHRILYIVHHDVRLTTEQYVLHRCDVRDCVNPEHLWVGSQHDNNMDCARKGRHYEGSKTHCQYGHEFTPENTYRNASGSRNCKECQRRRSRERWAQNREAMNARQRAWRAKRKQELRA